MMKRLVFLIISLALLIGIGLATTAAMAGVHGKIYGEMRWRWQGFDNWDRDSGREDGYGYNALRSRLGYKGMVGDRAFFKMSVENNRVLGGNNIVLDEDDVYPVWEGYPYGKGLFYNNDNDLIYLNEAYLGYEDFIFRNFTVKAGRFFLKYGNERFLGDNDWDTFINLRFDGFKGRYLWDDGWLDLICVWLAEAGSWKYTNGEGDQNLRGLYLHYDVNEVLWFEPYILALSAANVDYITDSQGNLVPFDSDLVWNFGLLLDYQAEMGLHAYGEVVIQTGKFNEMAPPQAPDHPEWWNQKTDISTSGYYIGVIYTFQTKTRPFLGAEWNYASGQAFNDTDDKIKTFVSPFGSIRNYMGIMNIVDWSNTNSWRFPLGISLRDGLDVKFDIYLMKSAKDRSVQSTIDPADTSQDLGTEIDFFVDYTLDDIAFTGGLGYFMWGGVFDYTDTGGNTASRDGTWFFWLGAEVAFP